jgi:carbon starvation protein
LVERVGERRPITIRDAAGHRTNIAGVVAENDDLFSLPLSSKGEEGNGNAAREHRDAYKKQPVLALITLVPLAWLLAVTITAGVQKIWHPDPRIGFLAQANVLSKKVASLEQAVAEAKRAGEPGAIEQAGKALRTNEVLRFNNRLDAAVAAGFLLLVTAIVLLSVWEWVLLLTRRKPAVLCETEPVWLPDYAVAESRPLHLAGVATVAFALAKELSGEAEMERARDSALLCECEHGSGARLTAMNGAQPRQASARIYVEVAEKRFKGVKQCC